MQIAEYYDSVASIWDDDYAEAKAARIVTAMVSIQRGGACVMDVGCGSGAMFADLMDGGACEIEGVDISGEMIRLALKYAFDLFKAERVTLGVFDNNQPAYRCYKAAGFKEFSEREVLLLGENWRCIDMECLRANVV